MLIYHLRLLMSLADPLGLHQGVYDRESRHEGDSDAPVAIRALELMNGTNVLEKRIPGRVVVQFESNFGNLRT